MALRDEENQPQAPDLGASVQLETGETLEDTGDSAPLDAGYIPPDRPYVLDEDGVTGAGMRDGDTLDQRLDREQDADATYPDPDRAGRIVVEDETGALSTPDALEGEDVGIDGGALGRGGRGARAGRRRDRRRRGPGRVRAVGRRRPGPARSGAGRVPGG